MRNSQIILQSYEIPFLLNPVCNEKQKLKIKNTTFNHSNNKRMPHFTLENQNYILQKYENMSNETLIWETKAPIIKNHKDIPYLYASVNAVVSLGTNKNKRLIKINSKTRYKYSDSVLNKISSNHLMDIYICMECFDIQTTDFIMLRNDNWNVQTITRNSFWWNEYNKLIINLYNNLISYASNHDVITNSDEVEFEKNSIEQSNRLQLTHHI